jgi:hypothetical protein
MWSASASATPWRRAKADDVRVDRSIDKDELLRDVAQVFTPLALRSFAGLMPLQGVLAGAVLALESVEGERDVAAPLQDVHHLVAACAERHEIGQELGTEALVRRVR